MNPELYGWRGFETMILPRYHYVMSQLPLYIMQLPRDCYVIVLSW